MYLTDYHTHSLCSFDGSAPLADLAQSAVTAGLTELCLTDHCDLVNTQGKPDLSFRWEPVEEQLSLARPSLRGNCPSLWAWSLAQPGSSPTLPRS